MDKSGVTSNEGLLDTAFDVVRRYKDFDAYGSGAKACLALQGRCPGFSAEQYTGAFRQAEHIYNVAKQVVERKKEMLLASWDHLHNIDHTEIDQEMPRRCPTFHEGTRNSALGWIFTWHYLR
jgi:hypothetical protein